MLLCSFIYVREPRGAFKVAAREFLRLLLGGGDCGLGSWLALLKWLKLWLTHCAFFPEIHLDVQIFKIKERRRHFSVSNNWKWY